MSVYPILEWLIVGGAVAASLWLVVRRFRPRAKSEGGAGACGSCSSCGGCAAPKTQDTEKPAHWHR